MELPSCLFQPDVDTAISAELTSMCQWGEVLETVDPPVVLGLDSLAKQGVNWDCTKLDMVVVSVVPAVWTEDIKITVT